MVRYLFIEPHTTLEFRDVGERVQLALKVTQDADEECEVWFNTKSQADALHNALAKHGFTPAQGWHENTIIGYPE